MPDVQSVCVHYNSMWEAYPRLIEHCKGYGKVFTPRQFKCLELRPHSFALKHPQLSLYNGKTRRLNYRFFAIETLGYLAGLNDKWYMDLLCDANSHMEAFRAPDGSLLWAYGPQLFRSLQETVNQLEKDPSSRQCICSIWTPGIEDKICANTPCTVMFHFFAEDTRRLAMKVYMRSNDLDWGTPYDVASFCTLQVMVAACLGWDVGSYYHEAGSLHLYEDHVPDAPGFTGHEAQLLSLSPIPRPDYIREYNYLGTAKSKMFKLQTQAECFLRSLAYHREHKLPWKEFEAIVAIATLDIPYGFVKYWNFWEDLIHFNWKDVMTSLELEELEEIEEIKKRKLDEL